MHPISSVTSPSTPTAVSAPASATSRGAATRSRRPPRSAYDTFSIYPGTPTWPPTHIEFKDGRCSLQSQNGAARVEFLEAATKININFSGCSETFRFPDGRHLAHCGKGVPRYWTLLPNKYPDDLKYQPIYATARFQPFVLSPDGKTAFCILGKDDAAHHVLKIQAKHIARSDSPDIPSVLSSERIDLPHELASSIGHISGMACNTAGALFIYSELGGNEQLHILENGNWRCLNLETPDPRFTLQSVFFISAVAPDGGSLVLTPHDVKRQPRLIMLDGPTQWPAWWTLPLTGDKKNPSAPCLFAYSQDSRYLALAADSPATTVSDIMKGFVIRLSALPKGSGNTINISGLHDFGCTVLLHQVGWHIPAPVDRNHVTISFGEDGNTVTRAIYNAEKKVVMEYTARLSSRITKPL